LKTYISVGGWAFNDLPTQHVFSNLAADVTAQADFAESLIQYDVSYSFNRFLNILDSCSRMGLMVLILIGKIQACLLELL
jgi:hypothetical protein